MRLNHNLFSLSIYNSYKTSVADGNTAMSKISSGMKINMAKDNPNKITHNEKLKISIVSTTAASKNAQDMSSMIQAVDGDMQQMNNVLTRLKELAVQGNNDTLKDADKETVQNEINALTDELDYIAKNSQFNGIKLIAGDVGAIKGSVGANYGEDVDLPTYDLTFDSLFPDGIDITGGVEEAGRTLTAVDDAIVRVASARAEYGAIQIRLDETQEGLNSINGSLEKAQSNIGDADIAEEIMNFTKNQTIAQAALALMSQSNNLPKDALQMLANVR